MKINLNVVNTVNYAVCSSTAIKKSNKKKKERKFFSWQEFRRQRLRYRTRVNQAHVGILLSLYNSLCCVERPSEMKKF